MYMDIVISATKHNTKSIIEVILVYFFHIFYHRFR